MRVAGISVAMASRQRPTAYLVILDDSSGKEVIEANQAFPADDVDLATQLHDTAKAVRSRLEGLAVERVIVRRADRPPSANNTEGPRLRLLMEGAVTRGPWRRDGDHAWHRRGHRNLVWGQKSRCRRCICPVAESARPALPLHRGNQRRASRSAANLADLGGMARTRERRERFFQLSDGSASKALRPFACRQGLQQSADNHSSLRVSVPLQLGGKTDPGKRFFQADYSRAKIVALTLLAHAIKACCALVSRRKRPDLFT